MLTAVAYCCRAYNNCTILNYLKLGVNNDFKRI